MDLVVALLFILFYILLEEELRICLINLESACACDSKSASIAINFHLIQQPCHG